MEIDLRYFVSRWMRKDKRTKGKQSVLLDFTYVLLRLCLIPTNGTALSDFNSNSCINIVCVNLDIPM